MEIEVLQGKTIDKSSIVSVKKMNHIFEICYTQKRNFLPSIQKLDKDNYVLLSTGEVKQCQHIESRADNKLQVSQSLKRLRDYINTNVVDVKNCKWINLTYEENMTDTKRLYSDFKKFIMKFRNKYGKFEYIVACEPQGRGAWHCHCIIIFDHIAPFIPNKKIEALWCHGFTVTKKLDNVDNVGAYLTAYLGDMELNDCKKNNISFSSDEVKEVSEIDGIKLKKPKKFVKGARLNMYPPGFNIYRISRGIKKPTKEYMSYEDAKEKIGLHSPTFSKAISLKDTEKKFENCIIYEYYNTKRK